MDPDDPLPFEVGSQAGGAVPRTRNKRRSSILKTSNARPVLQVRFDYSTVEVNLSSLY